MGSASSRLKQQIQQSKTANVLKKEAEKRRQDAARARQKRFETMKAAKPAGQKIRFSDSDDDENDKNPKQLFGDDNSDSDMDISTKLRPEFAGQTGGKLFEIERNFADDRFKVDHHFKDDDMAERVALENRKEIVARRKREFQNVRHIPKTPLFIGCTHFCTTNVGIWYYFGQETYIYFVAQETSIITKLFIF